MTSPTEHILNLPSIKTVGELKKYSNKVLIYLYKVFDKSQHIDCAWMGKVCHFSSNIDDSYPIKNIGTIFNDFLFLYRNKEFLPFNAKYNEFSFQKEDKFCNAQDEIFVPDAKMMVMYKLLWRKYNKEKKE